MSIVLPNANELRKVAEQTIEAKRLEWIENIKETVINRGKDGYHNVIVDDHYCGEFSKEIKNIFEPLGYNVSFKKYESSSGWMDYYIVIEW